MKLDTFDFDLPAHLIAQTPLRDRAGARLLAVEKDSGAIEDKQFKDISSYFSAGDTLVLNDTRVIPARLIGEKKETGAKIEMLLLAPMDDMYEVLIKPAKRVSVGTEISFGDDKLIATITEKHDEGIHKVRLMYDGVLETVLDELGEMPLPPYIKEVLPEKERYQTVFNKHSGSSAAPTAGLHFTHEMLSGLETQGVNIVYITLHVGLGTFRPVAVQDITTHKMHSEYYHVSAETAEILNQTKAKGKKIFSVGTTCTRTLESVMQTHGTFKACSGNTDIFIYPGFEFKAVDALITNFHLPKSSLIMLVSAFASRELIMDAYSHAIKEKYRFFSFGDAMIIY